MLSVMTLAEIDGTLDHREVRRLSQQLLVAGHETTASLISLMLYRLIEQPELIDWTCAGNRTSLPSAVEEFLRFDSPVQGLFRSNPEPSAVADAELPAGSRLQVLFASANRDDAVWDRPDELRLDRFGVGSRPHLAFGWGVHHCIGNALARREGELALRWIVERFDTVERTAAASPSTSPSSSAGSPPSRSAGPSNHLSDEPTDRIRRFRSSVEVRSALR